MRILMTGFDAFEKADVNPSQLAIERVDEALLRAAGVPDGVEVKTDVLATCCNEAWHKVEAQVRAVPRGEDFAILLTGYAGNRNRVCLERFALNNRSYRIYDNKGHKWQEEYIDKDAPDALRSKLPLPDLVQELENQGIAADVSNYAGTFVCNETYFRAMQKYNENPRCKGVLFVHVPPPIDYAGVNPEGKAPENDEEGVKQTDQAISEFARAYAIIAGFVAARQKQEVVAQSE
jgi:pyroglutamyl-peptidase